MAFQDELDAFRAGWVSRVGETTAALVAGDIEDLRNSGILERAAKASDAFPTAVNLLDVHAQPFDLTALIAAKPVVVVFYRGGWCPYCNLELRAYQGALSEIRAAGADLVAVSPELPDHTSSTSENNDVAFPILSDVGGQLASALGIRFELSDAVRPFYERAGHALPDRHGDGLWALPMPTTFVVERGGRIAAAFIEPDYRKRPDPRDALEALQTLNAAGKAA